MWAILVIVAVVIFWGNRMLSTFQGHVRTRSKVGVITHSTPVGGELLDGVFHPTPSDGALDSIRWRI